jgi:hypothetical protein
MIDPDNIGLDDESVPLENRLAWTAWLAVQKQDRATVSPCKCWLMLYAAAVAAVITYLWRWQ